VSIGISGCNARTDARGPAREPHWREPGRTRGRCGSRGQQVSRVEARAGPERGDQDGIRCGQLAMRAPTAKAGRSSGSNQAPWGRFLISMFTNEGGEGIDSRHRGGGRGRGDGRRQLGDRPTTGHRIVMDGEGTSMVQANSESTTIGDPARAGPEERLTVFSRMPELGSGDSPGA